MTSLLQRYQMIAMREDVCIRHTIATIALYLSCLLIDIDFKIEAAPQLNFFFKLRCAHPSVDVIDSSVLDMKGMNHPCAKKPVVGSLHKLWIRSNPIKRSRKVSRYRPLDNQITVRGLKINRAIVAAKLWVIREWCRHDL